MSESVGGESPVSLTLSRRRMSEGNFLIFIEEDIGIFCQDLPP